MADTFRNDSKSLTEVDDTVINLCVSPIQPRFESSVYDMTQSKKPSFLSNIIDIENYSASSNGIVYSTSLSNLKDDKSLFLKLDEDEGITIIESETAAQRLQRETAESEELARKLMAEEAIESYRQSASFLQAYASDYSREDFAMIQAAMGYEVSSQGSVDYEEHDDHDDQNDEEAEELLSPSSDMSYDALLRLGEQIGDVKTERWALRAKFEIAKLPTVRFDSDLCRIDENETKHSCLICQLQYESKEQLRHLPCDHFFHRECADQWLMTKDFCPYCRQSIL